MERREEASGEGQLETGGASTEGTSRGGDGAIEDEWRRVDRRGAGEREERLERRASGEGRVHRRRVERSEFPPLGFKSGYILPVQASYSA